MLADVSQQMKEQSTDDSASMAETYGTITNPNVRKRDRQGKRSVPATATATPAAKSVKKEPAPSTTKPVVPEPKVAEPIKQEPNEPTKAAPSSTAATKKGAAPPPSLKKSGSSGIMSSFAKAAAIASSKPKETPSKATTNSPANNSPALSDDGEDDDEDIPAAKSSANSGRKSRKDREAELKQMMEESEDEEDPEDNEEEPVDEPMEEAPEPEAEAKVEPEPAEIVSSTGDGRRRGKRRVMKKKQIMDDQGYLGMLHICRLPFLTLTSNHQSPSRSLLGRSSRRMRRLHRLPSPSLHLHQVPEVRLQSLKRPPLRDRATSCHFSLRNNISAGIVGQGKVATPGGTSSASPSNS